MNVNITRSNAMSGGFHVEAVTRNLFAAILNRIKRLALPPPDINGRMFA